MQFAVHCDGVIDIGALRLGEQADNPQLPGGNEG